MVAPYAAAKATAAGTLAPTILIPVTNAIESLHMQVRKVIKNRGHFPNDEAASKLIYLALRNITRDWKMPPREPCPRHAGRSGLGGWTASCHLRPHSRHARPSDRCRCRGAQARRPVL